MEDVKQENIDLTTVCRTCLKYSDVLLKLTESIISIDHQNVLLMEALTTCTPVQISKSEAMPLGICAECKNILEISYKFRMQTIKADAQLKKLSSTTVIKEELLDSINETYYDNYDSGHELSKSESSKSPKHCMDEKSFLSHLLTQEDDNEINGAIVHDNNIEVKTETDNVANDLMQCTVCSKTFTKERSLKSHMKRHRSDRKSNVKFTCDHCNKEFTLKTTLLNHVKLHERQSYQCSQCSKAFSRKDHLIYHMNKHNNVKSYVCTYCSKGFIQLCNLKDHVRIHTGEIPYLCTECGKGFSNSSNLRQHMLRHTGIKRFGCSLCPMKFITKGQMKCHMDTHSKIQAFKCDKCGSGFTKGASLKRHMKIHVGLKPYQCDECPMRFVHKDHLKRHYRIHTGEKPFNCMICERSFTQSNDLIKHMRTHLGKNIFECKVCKMTFRLQSELKHHYPVHYSNKTNLTENNDAIAATENSASQLLNMTHHRADASNVSGGPGHPSLELVLENAVQDRHVGSIIITYNDNILHKNGDLKESAININGHKS